jgi:hypothetical protein
MVHDAYLFVLQFHSSNFGMADRKKQSTVFSAARPREPFHGLWDHYIAEIDSD